MMGVCPDLKMAVAALELDGNGVSGTGRRWRHLTARLLDGKGCLPCYDFSDICAPDSKEEKTAVIEETGNA
ncbi:unnamed protein product [Cuscuta campestris]|uniref:Uncharacterized protein n=1 Tax=Cuscuta campestris TaxID=132261 RepID=A0A484M5A2_9ASTE|nr:unnamed protein product [Cuscuta campestris]